MKEQGIEIDKEKLQETSNEEDIENESFSIYNKDYKPEILKKLDRVLFLSDNITKIKKNKNMQKYLTQNHLKNLKNIRMKY